VNSAAKADVVVIGAGIAGASAAWALSREFDVALVELEAQPGLHASGRSAAVISETSGLPVVCALSAASRQFFANPPEALTESTLLSPRGLMWVSSWTSTGQLSTIAAAAESIGVKVDRLELAEACAHVPALRREWLGGALLEPDAMSIDVARLLGGFLAGFRANGGDLRLTSPALRLQPLAHGWRVACADGTTIECEQVVNAAGAWADIIAERAGLPSLGLQPLRRTAFTFPFEGARDWPLVMDVDGKFYFEPEGPGLLASPADETPIEPCDAQADDLAIAMATDGMLEATTIRVRGVRNRWAGLRTFAVDRIPVVGEDPIAPGFHWLAGQGGAGIKTAPALAEVIFAAVTGAGLPRSLDRLGIQIEQLSPARLR
jgi:D-arginine dehydrogenase